MKFSNGREIDYKKVGALKREGKSYFCEEKGHRANDFPIKKIEKIMVKKIKRWILKSSKKDSEQSLEEEGAFRFEFLNFPLFF
jgi:hypothetical protein